MNKKWPINKIIVLLCIGFLFSQCDDREEGCLNPSSTNYDVTADNPCDDCCTSPQVKLNLRIIVDSLSFNTNTWYAYVPNDTLAIKKLEFDISNVHVINEDGDIYQTKDSVIIGEELFPNDLYFFNSSPRTIDIASFEYVGLLKELNFELGIPEEVQDTLDKTTFATLNQVRDSLWSETDMFLSKLRFEYILKDSVDRDPLYLEDLSNELVSLEIDTLSIYATDLTITVNFDLAKWWDGIDFTNDDPADIKVKLQTQYKSSFSVQ